MPQPAASWRARLLLGLTGVLLAMGTAEGALRVGHFHFDLVPTLQFGWPDPATITKTYRPDADLVWVTHDYSDTIHAARAAHPAVVFMGDSCTEFGSYPARTIDKLKAAGSALTTGTKLGVGGWTSEQGLVQLRRDVIPLHPRIVTIYYGWNDHWIAMGMTDPEIMSAHRLLAIAPFSRIAQLWLRTKVAVAAQRKPVPNRVPLDRYEANLREMGREAKAAGITPIFVTAASNHVRGHEPEYLARRHLQSLSELVPLHAAYVDATRRAAHEIHADVCDAAADFAALPPPHDRYFRHDGIHLTGAGDEELAKLLTQCILQASGGR
jgi:lysophospholipase L1-like esterase